MKVVELILNDAIDVERKRWQITSISLSRSSLNTIERKKKMVAVWCRAPFLLFSVVYTFWGTWKEIYEEKKKRNAVTITFLFTLEKLTKRCDVKQSFLKLKQKEFLCKSLI
jgi:hypothetical protein